MMKFRFRRLVAEHQHRLYGLAVQMLGNPAEAEEVVQDALIKLWHHLEGLEAERVRPWLLTVTRNACLDLLRRRRFQAVPLAVGADEFIAGDVDDPAASYETADREQRLMDAVRQLKEPFRSLILLREVQGCSYAEVGQVLQLNPTQVKVYLHRARRKLRDLICWDDLGIEQS